MRFKALFLVALAAFLCFSEDADASGGDSIFPEEAAYVLLGYAAAAVASNVTFTTVDVAYAVRGERLPLRLALAETALSGAQLYLLVRYGDLEIPRILTFAATRCGRPRSPCTASCPS